MIGRPEVVNVIVVTPNRTKPVPVCAASNGWVVPKPRAVRSARERVSVQGVGVSEVVQAAGNAIHWATKMLVALLEDGVASIMAAVMDAATSAALSFAFMTAPLSTGTPHQH
jgi:hypothetical protein